jgi:hypothetical protein
MTRVGLSLRELAGIVLVALLPLGGLASSSAL